MCRINSNLDLSYIKSNLEYIKYVRKEACRKHLEQINNLKNYIENETNNIFKKYNIKYKERLKKLKKENNNSFF